MKLDELEKLLQVLRRNHVEEFDGELGRIKLSPSSFIAADPRPRDIKVTDADREQRNWEKSLLGG